MPKQTHLLSDVALRRLGFRLLCALYSQYEWAPLARDDDPDILDEFLNGTDEEISETLVSLAAMARAADDALGTLATVGKAFPHGVGELRDGTSAVPLSPREACNKVLHATDIQWQFDVVDFNPLYERFYQSAGIHHRGSFKRPLMILSGEYRGVHWEASVDIVPFVIAIANWNAAQYRFA